MCVVGVWVVYMFVYVCGGVDVYVCMVWVCVGVCVVLVCMGGMGTWVYV